MVGLERGAQRHWTRHLTGQTVWEGLTMRRKPRPLDSEEREGSFDDWAGRIIDLLAGVGLISALVGLSLVSGLMWDQFGL